jgi:DNA-binding winged helix-turn-helix (wHTH) protein/tetratricopeptide (TPR) repeat protein
MALSAQQPSRVIRFGAFEIDAGNGELRKGGVSLKIHPQPFRVLVLLAEHPGQTVTREEIQRSLWGDNTFVDFERGINFCINQIRVTLGDDAEKPKYIETLPRRGYRFVAPVAGYEDKKPTLRLATLRFALPLTVIGVVAALTAGGLLLRSRNARRLTEKDTIVLTDFSNSTGDPVFDGTLRQGLVVELQQSPFLSLISDDRMRETLRLMGQPTNTKLTAEIGRELCQRMGSAAIVSGSIANLGSQYVLGLKAISCSTGDSLAEEQETAGGKEKVLAALSQAATKLRRRLGESLKSIEKFDAPLEQATTPSLEALQAYSYGRRTYVGSDSRAPIPALERAVHLDPNFALAYAQLGLSYMGIGEERLGEESLRKAYELRDRVSERERFFVETSYYLRVTGNRERARQTCELWKQTYPRDSVPVAFLGYVLRELGQHERSLEELREALRRDPGTPVRYTNLVWTYGIMNRLKEARATATEAQGKMLDSPDLHRVLFGIAFLENDAAAMTREVGWSMSKPWFEHAMLNSEAGMFVHFGKLKKARELTDRAVSLAEHEGRMDTAANYQASQAFAEVLLGGHLEARKRAADALKLSSAKLVVIVAAMAGDKARAPSLIADLNKRYSDDTLLQNTWLPLVKAQLALDHDDAQTAIAVLQSALTYESALGDGLVSAFERGKAHLLARSGNEAAVEFQKIMDHRGVVTFADWKGPVVGTVLALANVDLARAYVLQGDSAKARAAYQDFFTLWKDADPDIPILKQAKAEYARLK